jgi:hypothetical protein
MVLVMRRKEEREEGRRKQRGFLLGADGPGGGLLPIL